MLDGLRGLFALLVLFYHYRLWLELSVPVVVEDFLTRIAVYGVCGFFVISGASMALAYRRTPLWDFAGLCSFFVKRFFRIAPLFYLVLFIHTAGRLQRCVTGGACTLDFEKLAANVLFVFGFGKAAEQSAVVAGWSIGIEWVFYFMFPLLFWFAVRGRAALLVMVVCSIGILHWWNAAYVDAGSVGWTEYAQLPAYLVYFIVGICIGISRADYAPSHGLARSAAWIFGGLLIAYLVADLSVPGVFDSARDIAAPQSWLLAR